MRSRDSDHRLSDRVDGLPTRGLPWPPRPEDAEFRVAEPPQPPRRWLALVAIIVVLIPPAAVLVYYARRTAEVGARVEISIVPDDATVAIDGVTLPGRSPYALSLTAGTHTLTATREGFTRLDRSLDLEPGKTLYLPLVLLREGPPPALPRATAPGHAVSGAGRAAAPAAERAPARPPPGQPRPRPTPSTAASKAPTPPGPPDKPADKPADKGSKTAAKPSDKVLYLDVKTGQVK